MYCSRCSTYQCECEDYPIETEIRDLKITIQSLEQEVARIREENLKLRNCHNCKFPIFDYGEMDCHKKDKSFYDKYDFSYCDNWEIEK